VGSGLKSPAGVAIGPVGVGTTKPGTTVTLHADAFPAGAGAPTGTVTFSVGPLVLGTVDLSENASGIDGAQLVTKALPAATDHVVVRYSGNSAFASSSAGATIIVVK
jgi:hypothetical protein